MSKVGPYICWDEVVNAATGDEDLDNILDILDFPIESLEGEEFVGDWDVSNSDYLGPIPSDVLIHPPTIACSKADTGPRNLMPTPQTKVGATPKPKQLPFKFREHNKSTEVQDQGVFHTQSPVSVLESSRSSSAAKSSLIKPRINKRARSKRSRPSALSTWLLISSPLVVSSPASRKAHNARKNKERKKLSLPSVAPQTSEDDSKNPTQTVPKKCAHCEVTKTPQWREGPTGPKTLCNACGVRYRSGRLFPEYRPAASPTFVPSIHSNSHKKVVEMRTKGKQHAVTKTEVPLNSSYMVHRIC